MLFRRRKPEGLFHRARTFLWPRRSFSRSFQYVTKRILRLSATPHAVAAGVAAGVFISWTPFIGLHLILAAALTYILAGNMLASALGTAFGNPLTFPIIWSATYNLGKFLQDGRILEGRSDIDLISAIRMSQFRVHGLWDHLAALWPPLLKPMLLGALPLGLITAAICYALTYWAVLTFREQKRKRLAARARRRLGSEATV